MRHDRRTQPSRAKLLRWTFFTRIAAPAGGGDVHTCKQSLRATRRPTRARKHEGVQQRETALVSVFTASTTSSRRSTWETHPRSRTHWLCARGIVHWLSLANEDVCSIL